MSLDGHFSYFFSLTRISERKYCCNAGVWDRLRKESGVSAGNTNQLVRSGISLPALSVSLVLFLCCQLKFLLTASHL